MGNVLLCILEGTWASSITLFHGFPFVLSGLTVVTSGCYPTLLGWLGFLGGLGSLVAGPFMFSAWQGCLLACPLFPPLLSVSICSCLAFCFGASQVGRVENGSRSTALILI